MEMLGKFAAFSVPLLLLLLLATALTTTMIMIKRKKKYKKEFVVRKKCFEIQNINWATPLQRVSLLQIDTFWLLKASLPFFTALSIVFIISFFRQQNLSNQLNVVKLSLRIMALKARQTLESLSRLSRRRKPSER